MKIPIGPSLLVLLLILSAASAQAQSSGVLMVVSQTLSGGVCPHTSDPGDFAIGSGTLNLNLTNASIAGGTYYACVQATKAGIPTKYQEVTITVTGGGGGSIACDYGPSYQGSIPAPAAAAGFTHCAANYDFTQTGSFTNNGHTYQWSNASTWLDCAGSSAPLFYGTQNCSGFFTTQDGGTQVLDMQASGSDQAAGGLTLSSFKSTGGQTPQSGVSFPQNFYFEFITRSPSSNLTNCCTTGPSSAVTDSWLYDPSGLGSSPPGVSFSTEEFDFIETGSDGGYGMGGCHEWSGYYCGAGNSVGGLDLNTYLDLGWRMTVDSSGNIANCTYHNNSGFGSPACNTANYLCQTAGSCGFSAPTQNNRFWHVLWSGTTGIQGSGPVHLYIQRETFWTCANWIDSANPGISNDYASGQHQCFTSPISSP